MVQKLDGVAPLITDPPPTSSSSWSKNKWIYITYDTLHVTNDIWRMTPYMWHVTRDMQHMTGGGRWIFSQNVSSLTQTVWEWRCFEDFFWKAHLINQSVSDKGVCRTVPATPGLLNIYLGFWRCKFRTI